MSPTNMVIIAFVAFSLKHFVIDFPLQPAWMYRVKHILFHPGGIAHSAFHGAVTFILLMVLWYYGIGGAKYAAVNAATIGLLEFVAHYFIDYTKMNLNLYLGWGPTTCEQFWWLLGLDQLLHYLTYCAIIWLWFA